MREIRPLRHQVLRAGMPVESAVFDGDEDAQTLHIAAVMADGTVVGCASFIPRPHPDTGEPGWQLRGMAVRADRQGQGIGADLLNKAEVLIRSGGGPLLLWCNARTPAVPFYQRNGWRRFGDEFIVETAGPHFRMDKRLGEASPGGAWD